MEENVRSLEIEFGGYLRILSFIRSIQMRLSSPKSKLSHLDRFFYFVSCKFFSEWLFGLNNGLSTSFSFCIPQPSLSFCFMDKEVKPRGVMVCQGGPLVSAEYVTTARQVSEPLSIVILQHNTKKAPFILSHHSTTLSLTLSPLVL